MNTLPRLRCTKLLATTMALTLMLTTMAGAAAPQPGKDVIIRGCLAGAKLTHIEAVRPETLPSDVPDILRVSTIRVIRSQVKSLDGHQVELIGTLRGIPGQENGILVADSSAKIYVGGSDSNIGSDLRTERTEPPTMHAHTIKDIAPACSAGPSK